MDVNICEYRYVYYAVAYLATGSPAKCKGCPRAQENIRGLDSSRTHTVCTVQS